MKVGVSGISNSHDWDYDFLFMHQGNEANRFPRHGQLLSFFWSLSYSFWFSRFFGLIAMPSLCRPVFMVKRRSCPVARTSMMLSHETRFQHGSRWCARKELWISAGRSFCYEVILDNAHMNSFFNLLVDSDRRAFHEAFSAIQC